MIDWNTTSTTFHYRKVSSIKYTDVSNLNTSVTKLPFAKNIHSLGNLSNLKVNHVIHHISL